MGMSCLSLCNSLEQVIRPRMERGCQRCYGVLCCPCLGPERKGGSNRDWQELVLAKMPRAWGKPSTFLPTPLKAGVRQETENVAGVGQGTAVLAEPWLH